MRTGEDLSAGPGVGAGAGRGRAGTVPSNQLRDRAQASVPHFAPAQGRNRSPSLRLRDAAEVTVLTRSLREGQKPEGMCQDRHSPWVPQAGAPRVPQVQSVRTGSLIPHTNLPGTAGFCPWWQPRLGTAPQLARPPSSQGGRRDYPFSWSWMNFPKRLLLLFLRVHAFPADHSFCSEAPRAKVATGLPGPRRYPQVTYRPLYWFPGHRGQG